jgi:hypothetical protein
VASFICFQSINVIGIQYNLLQPNIKLLFEEFIGKIKTRISTFVGEKSVEVPLFFFLFSALGGKKTQYLLYWRRFGNLRLSLTDGKIYCTGIRTPEHV